MTKIEEVKMMSSDVTEQCNSADWENIDRSVQALINLSSDVKQRLQKLLEELCVDDQNIHHQNIQVDTLKFEQDRSVQADTLSLPVPDSGVFLSTNISASPGTPDHLPELERDDPPVTGLEDKTETELTNEMDQIIEDCKNHLQDIEKNIESSNDKRFLGSELATASSRLRRCQQYSNLLRTTHGLTGEDIRADTINEMDLEVRRLGEAIKEAESAGPSSELSYSEAVKSGSVSPGTTCPLCRRKNWRQLEGDLWRLERWLEHAERQLAQHLRNGVPSSIEQLEEVIQDHREFLLDLDSHKSVAMSINVVGCHLAEHSPTQSKADGMRQRLADINEKWDAVCEQATLWQTRLQTALLENGEFHQTILELQQWLDATTATIREAEPVDLRVARSVLQTKYHKFLELLKDLHRFEPRVVSLQEATDQLELQADSSSCREVKTKLAVLSRSLRLLIRVCSVYLTNLARALDIEPPAEVVQHPSLSLATADSQYSLDCSETGLPPLTNTLITAEPPLEDDPAVATSGLGAVPRQRADTDVNTSVLSRSYRLLGRVVRAAVPIQVRLLE